MEGNARVFGSCIDASEDIRGRLKMPEFMAGRVA